LGRKEELLAQYEARIVNAHNASFAGMTIDGPVFRYAGREYPINSISAEVIVGAQTSKSRSTATRIIGGGLVAGPGGMLLGGAAKKKTDTSKVYITVKLGDGSVHSISKPANQEGQLRRFADQLESAVNRKWPITTPFGTTLELDRTSVRQSAPSQTTPVIFGAIAITVLLLFVIKGWALLIGLVSVVAIMVVEHRRTQAFYRELDEHFPGWREEADRAQRISEDRMWQQARDKARDPDTETRDAVQPKPPAKSSKVRCHRCQHVQEVPLNQSTFTCEQCNTTLRRRTPSAESS
jgi:ribosomal protein S27E